MPGSWPIKGKLRGNISILTPAPIANTSGLKAQKITSKKINFIMAPKILLRPTGLNNNYTTSTGALPLLVA
jgi:hypothetical protein